MACDIRGRYPESVNEPLFAAIGAALGELWPDYTTVLLAGDVRHSTPSLMAAIASGLQSSKVTVCRPLATPLSYFVSRRFGFDCTLIVTASHNPSEYNGLKLLHGRRPPSTEELCRLRTASERLLATRSAVAPADITPTDGRAWEALYSSTLVALAPAARSLRVVVDPGNGCLCGLAASVLQAAGHDVVEINGTLDGTFPGRGPDPTAPEAWQPLSDTVKRFRADLGVAFDGDGDRAVFVDELGVRVPGDSAAFLLAAEADSRYPGNPVVLDIRTSRSLTRLLTAEGAEVVWSYPGHALVRSTMTERSASFAGELSGHYFFRELGHDDGLYATLRVTGLVGRHGFLSEMVGALPHPPGLDELRLAYGGEPEQVYTALERAGLQAEVERGPLGMVLTWDGAWALVRPSITEPLLAIRGEADSIEELERMRRRLAAALATIGVHLN